MFAASWRRFMFGFEPEAARRTRGAAVVGGLLLWSACLSAAFAQELHVPSDERLHGLSALYASDAVGIVSDVCVQRFSQTRSDWEQTTIQWRHNNQDSIAELGQLQSAVGGALRAARPVSVDVDTWAAIVNARVEWVATVYQMLAPLDDIQAKPYCDAARLGFSHDLIAATDMAQARKAAAAAVEDLRKHK